MRDLQTEKRSCQRQLRQGDVVGATLTALRCKVKLIPSPIDRDEFHDLLAWSFGREDVHFGQATTSLRAAMKKMEKINPRDSPVFRALKRASGDDPVVAEKAMRRLEFYGARCSRLYWRTILREASGAIRPDLMWRLHP